MFVFPGELGCVLAIPIPPLVPRSSYTGHSTPVGVVSYPLSLSGPTATFKIGQLNRWHPAHQRTGIVILTPDYGLDYIIRFSSTTGKTAPPRYVAQGAHIFSGIPLERINVVPDSDAIACGFEARDGWLGLKLHAFPQHADGHFLPSHTQRFRITDESLINARPLVDFNWLARSQNHTHTGHICPMTGSILIAKVDSFGRLPAHSADIAIASFDPSCGLQDCELVPLVPP